MNQPRLKRNLSLKLALLTTVLVILTLVACDSITGAELQVTLTKPEPTATAQIVLGVDIPLRIMPMGDSITEGVCDTQDTCKEPSEWMIPTRGDGVEACGWAANPYNPEAIGYRAYLRDMIVTKGLIMNYVGSVTVAEGLAHEGHTGWQIEDLDYCVQNSDWLEKAQPNVILLHIGTNDASGGKTPEMMAENLQALLEHIYDRMPNTTEVIVAQIIPAKQSSTRLNRIITSYNELIPDVVEKLCTENLHVSYVDMTGVIHSDSDLDKFFGQHPNLEASERMAQVWYVKILEVFELKP